MIIVRVYYYRLSGIGELNVRLLKAPVELYLPSLIPINFLFDMELGGTSESVRCIGNSCSGFCIVSNIRIGFKVAWSE